MINCSNCELALNGPFCSNCGQSAKSRRGPIWQVTKEFADDIFSIDSKVLKSLFVLLLKPGVLTKQFLDGKRASVLPPVRLYLVMSILFFFVFQIPSPDVSKDNVYIGQVLLGKDKATKGAKEFKISLFDTSDEANAFEKWSNSFFLEKEEIMKKTNAQVTVDRIFNSLEEALPNLLILFLPLFAVVLKLLYYFKRISNRIVLYFDHLIFCLHFQTWLMAVVLIIYGLALQNPWWSALSVFIPLYLARAQKMVYQQTYWLVIPKTMFIFVIYLVLMLVASMVAFMSSVVML